MTNSEWNNLDDYMFRLFQVMVMIPIAIIFGVMDGCKQDRRLWPYVPDDLYM